MLPDLRAPLLVEPVALIVGGRVEACDKALLMSYYALPSSRQVRPHQRMGSPRHSMRNLFGICIAADVALTEDSNCINIRYDKYGMFMPHIKSGAHLSVTGPSSEACQSGLDVAQDLKH